MKTTVIHARDLPDQHAARWRELQQLDPTLGSPYFSPTFTRVVGQIRHDAYVCIMQCAGAWAYFPFQRSRFGFGRPIAGPLSDYHGIVSEPGLEIDAEALLGACRLANWTFDHLPRGQMFAAHRKITDHSPIMDLSGGYEQYRARHKANGSKQIYQIESAERRMSRELGFDIAFELHTNSNAALDRLMQWKSAQYLQCGTVDRFSFPWARQLLSRLHREHTTPDQNGFSAVLSVLRVGGRAIAAHFGMRCGSVLHYWFPAYDPAFEKYRPGLILLLKMAQTAAADGVKTIDLGKGDETYKQRLMTGGHEIAAGEVAVPSIAVGTQRLIERSERWIRSSPLGRIARLPGRYVARAIRQSRFR